MHEKLGAYSGGIRAATSQFSGAGEGGPKQIAFEAVVTNDGRRLLWRRQASRKEGSEGSQKAQKGERAGRLVRAGRLQKHELVVFVYKIRM